MSTSSSLALLQHDCDNVCERVHGKKHGDKQGYASGMHVP